VKYKIEYYNTRIFPNGIDNQIGILWDRVKKNNSKPDQVDIYVKQFETYLINWFADHQKE